jgi:hypothetical protein
MRRVNSKKAQRLEESIEGQRTELAMLDSAISDAIEDLHRLKVERGLVQSRLNTLLAFKVKAARS